MPTSLQGFGTTFYGKRDFQPDGSYVTTEFFIFAGIPIVPRKSLRVRDGGSKGVVFPIAQTERTYAVLDTTRPNVRQVLSVYGFFAFLIGWIIAVSMAHRRLEVELDRTTAGLLWWVLCASPAMIPMTLRRLAKRKVETPQIPPAGKT